MADRHTEGRALPSPAGQVAATTRSKYAPLAEEEEGCCAVRRGGHGQCGGGQQERPGGAAAGQHAGGESLGRGKRILVPGNLSPDSGWLFSAVVLVLHYHCTGLQAGVEAGVLQLVDSVLQRPGLWEQQGGQGNSGKPGPGLLQEEERQAQQRPCCN